MSALEIKSRPLAVGYLEMLWHFTAEFAPQGDIGRYSDDRIEGALDWSGTRGRLVKALTTSGWVDFDLSTRLLVHDWEDHCDEAVRKKLQRAKLQFHRLSAKVTGQNQILSASRAPVALASALPEPQLQPPPVNGTAEFPAILAEIRKHDAAADDVFCRRLMTTVVQFCLSSQKYPQDLIGELTDENVARCVAESYRTGPRGHGTGLLLNRVPNIVLTWSLED